MLVLKQLTVNQVKDNALENKYQILIVRGIGVIVLLDVNEPDKGHGQKHRVRVELVMLVLKQLTVNQVKEVVPQILTAWVIGVLVLLVVKKQD